MDIKYTTLILYLICQLLSIMIFANLFHQHYFSSYLYIYVNYVNCINFDNIFDSRVYNGLSTIVCQLFVCVPVPMSTMSIMSIVSILTQLT